MLKIKISTNQKYLFESVNVGDLFEYNNSYYIKTETTNFPGSCIIQANAVNIQNGELVRFLPNNQVYLLDAEMVITRRDMSSYEE